MIDNSDIIFFYTHYKNRSGSYKALEYARKKKKRYINFYKEELE